MGAIERILLIISKVVDQLLRISRGGIYHSLFFGADLDHDPDPGISNGILAIAG